MDAYGRALMQYAGCSRTVIGVVDGGKIELFSGLGTGTLARPTGDSVDEWCEIVTGDGWTLIRFPKRRRISLLVGRECPVPDAVAAVVAVADESGDFVLAIGGCPASVENSTSLLRTVGIEPFGTASIVDIAVSAAVTGRDVTGRARQIAGWWMVPSLFSERGTGRYVDMPRSRLRALTDSVRRRGRIRLTGPVSESSLFRLMVATLDDGPTAKIPSDVVDLVDAENEPFPVDDGPILLSWGDSGPRHRWTTLAGDGIVVHCHVALYDVAAAIGRIPPGWKGRLVSDDGRTVAVIDEPLVTVRTADGRTSAYRRGDDGQDPGRPDTSRSLAALMAALAGYDPEGHAVVRDGPYTLMGSGRETAELWMDVRDRNTVAEIVRRRIVHRLPVLPLDIAIAMLLERPSDRYGSVTLPVPESLLGDQVRLFGTLAGRHVNIVRCGKSFQIAVEHKSERQTPTTITNPSPRRPDVAFARPTVAHAGETSTGHDGFSPPCPVFRSGSDMEGHGT